MLYREPSQQLTGRASPPSAISDPSTQPLLRQRRPIRNTRSIRQRSTDSFSKSTRSASSKLAARVAQESPSTQEAPSNVTAPELNDSIPRNLTQPTTLQTITRTATENLPEFTPETGVVEPEADLAIAAAAVPAQRTTDPRTLVSGLRSLARPTPTPAVPALQPNPNMPGDQRPADERNTPLNKPVGEPMGALPIGGLPPPPPPGNMPTPLPPPPTTIFQLQVKTVMVPTTIIQMLQPTLPPGIQPPPVVPPPVQPNPIIAAPATTPTPGALPGGHFNSSFVVDAIKNPDASAAPGISSLGETGKVSPGIAAFIVFAVLGVLGFIAMVIWAMTSRHKTKKKELVSAKLGPGLDVKEVKH
ncbi:hypothetical protein HYALB_00002772 [Hymenoscyphus albidus]|uniref:Uncharacterized protein n=1 Tax=Hymenoscyphus albidus TaxID=595503 RepID=A0A9N9LEY7_9HELO|nr:hypothetical protein HYALB_00002772 [Hymenoscyphus albidus]